MTRSIRDPPEAVRRALEAILYLERAVLRTDGVEGTVLRHGGFYGPGTSLGEGGFQLEGTGVDASHRRWRHRGVVVIHIDDAASATLAAIERANPGLHNIVDDERRRSPSGFRPWPKRSGGQASPESPCVAGSPIRGRTRGSHDDGGAGASNAKAKRELGWQPAYPSWRVGFRWGLGSVAPSKAAERKAVNLVRGFTPAHGVSRRCCGPPARPPRQSVEAAKPVLLAASR
jgi:hypothetical protein